MPHPDPNRRRRATVAHQSLPQIEWHTNDTGSAAIAFIAAAERGKAAIREACLELRRQVDLINADRIARGVPPLPNNITVPGAA